MRSLFALRFPFKALAAVMLVAFTLPVEAKPARKKATTTKSKKAAKAAKAAPAAAAEPAAAEPAAEPTAAMQAAPTPAPVPAQPEAEPPAPKPAAKPAASQAVAARPSSAAPPAAIRPAPVAAASTRMEDTTPASKKLRIGVGVDVFTEDSRMSGEQAINTSRRDESFDYSGGNFLSVSLGMSVPAPIASERARIGGGVRLFGNYTRGGDGQFGFGLLNQAFITGEYGLPVGKQFEAMFGARGGLALLVPGRELSAEINRLQEQGVDVWSVPRVGWLVGPSLGARRQMSERIWLRADLLGQVGAQYLFATSQEISGFRYSKNWSTLGLRLGLSLGAEFSL